MKLRQLFILLLVVNFSALISVVFIISEYQNAIKQLENAYIMQHRSLVLADELRQSSDDLTRMARTHVITGNDMFKEQFHTVLNIRNGLQKRPKYYNRIYWDFYTLDNTKPVFDGEKIPLRNLMKKAGFPEEELALLYKSQEESDDLTNLEAKAMNAVRGIFQDDKGDFTILGKPDFELATKIMHSNEYHKAKIAIMKPLNAFYKAFETRTQERVNEAHETVKKMEMYLSIAVLFLVVLFLFSFFFIILYRIIHPLQLINKSMLKLAKNNMDITVPHNIYTDEVGDMASSLTVFKDNAIKLMASQEQNKRLLDLAGEGIFGLDARGRFTFVNPMASKLLGYTSEELIGKFITKTIGKELFEKDSSQRVRLMILPSEKEASFLSKANGVFPIDYVSTPIYSNKNILEGSVVVFSDITKRKEHEETLTKATLEAQKANQSKSIFLTNMSHELRTPLNAIMGFATLLQKSKHLNKTEKDNLETIYTSGKHLLSIINEILEFAKIEAGKIRINQSEVNLEQFLKDIELMFAYRCEDKGLNFKLVRDFECTHLISCDEQRLRQVFINILGNALKFTNEGFIMVKVQMINEHLQVSIEDSGIGISKSAQKLIFRPFEQDDLNKQTTTGTGLGLAITKELVEKMGGEISFKSEEKVGTTFRFSVKIKQLNKQIESKHNRSFPLKSLNLSSETYTILIADDLPVNRDLLRQFLTAYHIETYEVSDGLEALKACEQNKFDMIFMDILMPNLNGLETIYQLRKKLEYSKTPIIAISANVFEEDKQKALDSGADGFLSKPFDEKDILNVLMSYLNLEVVSHENKQEVNQDVTLDKSIQEKLINACHTLDKESVEKILQESNLEQSLKDTLLKYLHEYRFDTILETIQR